MALSYGSADVKVLHVGMTAGVVTSLTAEIEVPIMENGTQITSRRRDVEAWASLTQGKRKTFQLLIDDVVALME